MSTCAQSYGSLDDSDTDETFHQPHGSTRYTSYAAAASSQKPPIHHDGPSECTTTASSLPTDVEVTGYRSTIANLQAEATIASLQAEIKLLRTQLLGAQTPSTVTKMSQPTPSESTRMDSLESSMAAMTTKVTKWIKEVCHIVHPPESAQGTKHHASHDDQPQSQSKRADTRCTPDRRNPMDIQDPRSGPLLNRENSFRHLPLSPQRILTQRLTPPTTPRDTDPDHDTLYSDNGDGSLFVVGTATSGDYDTTGRP